MVRPKRTKPDSNQAQITEELRALGYDVDDVHDLPGLYDLIVSGSKCLEYPTDYTVCSVRVEIKSEGGELNETEKEYYEKQNHKGSYLIARTTEDILRWFGRI
jgi:hypothetical protein